MKSHRARASLFRLPSPSRSRSRCLCLLQLNFAFCSLFEARNPLNLPRVEHLLIHLLHLFIYSKLFIVSYCFLFSSRARVSVWPVQGFFFQIGYCETDDQLPGRSLPQYTLYLVVANEKERVDWIRAIRAGKSQ